MLIEVLDLEVAFGSNPERRVVVDLPRFTLAPGEAVAITGPSGTGKSTFLHLLSGMLRPTRGQVLFMGQQIDTLSERERDRLRASKIGLIHQGSLLLPHLTVRENVELALAFHPEPRPERVGLLLRRLGIDARGRQKVDTLSFGERQRVAIARALVGAPSLVLADEPTASLDAENARAAFHLLLEVAREENAALLAVTHDLTAREVFADTRDWLTLNRARGDA
ncbi:MAG: ABC transporter ATP-binding protein [Candidatus Eisenbacteria bacterium]|nr:ABC transporter ATP-binding protein [Candidatus Eisenbacteria bacterium]